jgi:hydrophobic/amphiphilic exporter-1 (mainly G- bacteria), HAE1 family
MKQATAEMAGRSGTALFVRRPILAMVLSALIVIAGIASLFGVEVRELPNVDRPVITVTTEFPGASPETVDQEITSRIEGAVGRVAGVRSISSNSRFGRSRVTLEFAADADIDVAATDTRDAVARIANALPEGAETPRIVKADADAQPVVRIAVTSATRSAQDLTRLVDEQVADRLVSIDGVADLQIYGDRSPIFRVDIDLMELASRGLTLADLRATLSDAAYDAPAGDLSGDRQSINVRTTATVATPEAFEALVIRENVRVGDVARVSLGPAPNETILRANGETGLGLGIVRQATSNTLSISEGVRATVAELQEMLPDDVNIFITSDDAVFIRGSIEEVLKTLALAVAIVVVVIFIFLRDLRATMIPALTMPVALIGTLAAIYLVGFSVNILTLLALVLATGMVVDDAIVVLENIVRRRSEGMGPRAAAVLGTQQVFFAVVTTTATLAAVFVPLSFLPGQAGGLFREFGFTLAMAVALSSIVALTLCPVLASRLLTAEGAGSGSGGFFGWLGDRLAALYAWTLRGALAYPFVVVIAAGLFAATAAMMATGIRQELTPPEDRAVALLSVSAPQGVSLEYTTSKMREIESLIEPLRESGEITNVFSITGFGSNSRGFMVMTLSEWDTRERSQQEIVGQINGALRSIVGVRAFAIQPNSLGIRGAGRGLTFAITGNDYGQLEEVATALVRRMQENPAFGQVRLEYETTQPQLFIEIDRTRASDLGIEIAGLGDALRAVLDGRSVGSVFVGDTSFDIQLLSTSNPVNDPTDLENVFVQAGDGQMIPMSTFVMLEERAVAPELEREGQNRSVEISASLTPDLPARFRAGAGRGAGRRGAGSTEQRGASGRGRDTGRDVRRPAPDLRLRHPHRLPRPLRAVRELHLRGRGHGHRASGHRLRHLRAGADGAEPEHLQPDRLRHADRDHGEERYPHCRVRQPAPRPGRERARRDPERQHDPAPAGDDDDDLDGAGRSATDPVVRRRRRGAGGARLGDRGRPRAGDALHALPHSGGLPPARAFHKAQGRGGGAPDERTGRSKRSWSRRWPPWLTAA